MLFAINFTEDVPSHPGETKEEMMEWLKPGGNRRDVARSDDTIRSSEVSVLTLRMSRRVARNAECIWAKGNRAAEGTPGPSPDDLGVKVSKKRLRSSPVAEYMKKTKAKPSGKMATSFPNSEETKGISASPLPPLDDADVLQRQIGKVGADAITHEWAEGYDDTLQYGYLVNPDDGHDGKSKANTEVIEGAEASASKSEEKKGVLVTSLSPLVDWKALRRQFSKCGRVLVAHVWAEGDDDTVQSGYLEFEDASGQADALEMKGLDIGGRRIDVREITFDSLPAEVKRAVEENRAPMKPKDSNSTLFIGNLTPEISNADLYKYFDKYGALYPIRRKSDRTTETLLNWAYVDFKSPEHAQRALSQYRLGAITDSDLRVEFAAPKAQPEAGEKSKGKKDVQGSDRAPGGKRSGKVKQKK